MEPVRCFAFCRPSILNVETIKNILILKKSLSAICVYITQIADNIPFALKDFSVVIVLIPRNGSDVNK